MDVSLENVLAKFRRPDVEWKLRVSALQEAVSIAHNATAIDEVTAEILQAEIRELGPYLALCIEDLRSTLVKEAGQCIQVLAETWGQEFVLAVGDVVFPALLKRSATTKAVIRESAVNAAKAMFDNGVEGVSTNMAGLLSDRVLDRKLPRLTRAAAAQFVGMMLVENCIYGLQIISNKIRAALVGGCEDADEEVRKISRQNWCRLEKIAPMEAAEVLKGLSPHVKALVLKEAGHNSLQADHVGYSSETLPVSRKRMSISRPLHAQRVHHSAMRSDSGSATLPMLQRIIPSPTADSSSSPDSGTNHKPPIPPFGAPRSRPYRVPQMAESSSVSKTPSSAGPAALPPRVRVNKRLPVMTNDKGGQTTGNMRKRSVPLLKRGPRRSMAPNTMINLSATTPLTPIAESESESSKTIRAAKDSPPTKSEQNEGSSASPKTELSLAVAESSIFQEASPSNGAKVVTSLAPAVDLIASASGAQCELTPRGVESISDSASKSSVGTPESVPTAEGVALVGDSTGSRASQEASSPASSLARSLTPSKASLSPAQQHLEAPLVNVDEKEDMSVVEDNDYSQVTVADSILPKTPDEKQSYLQKLRLSFIMGKNVSPTNEERRKTILAGILAKSKEYPSAVAGSETTDVAETCSGKDVEELPFIQHTHSEQSAGSVLDLLADEDEKSPEGTEAATKDKEAPEPTLDEASLLMAMFSSLADTGSKVPAPKMSQLEQAPENRSWDSLVEDIERNLTFDEAQTVGGSSEISAEAADEMDEKGPSPSAERTTNIGERWTDATIVDRKEPEQKKQLGSNSGRAKSDKENELPGDNVRTAGKVRITDRATMPSKRAAIGKPPLAGKPPVAVQARMVTKAQNGSKAPKPSTSSTSRRPTPADTAGKTSTSAEASRKARGPRRSIMPGSQAVRSLPGARAGTSRGGDGAGGARGLVIKKLQAANRARKGTWQERAASLGEFSAACQKLTNEKLGINLAEDCVGMLGAYGHDGHFRVVTAALDGLFYLLLCADRERCCDALRRALERNEGVLGRVLQLSRDGRENVRLAAERALQSFSVQFRPETRAGLVLRAVCGGRRGRASTDGRVLEMGCVQLVRAFEGARVSGEGFVWKGTLLEGVLVGVGEIGRDRRVEVRRAAGEVLKGVRGSLPDGAFEMACEKYGVEFSE